MSSRTESELSFDFQNALLRQGPFRVGDKEYSAEDVVEKLLPLVEPRRLDRIDQVIASRTYNVTTVTEQLYDVGNISAVMRSAESFGFLSFRILDKAGSLYKQSDRISRGSEKWLDLQHSNDIRGSLRALKTKGFKLYGTSLDNSRPIEELDFSVPVAIVFGNERDGLSPESQAEMDQCFHLPMQGFTQSFNISVAAALCFQHIHRERTEKLGSSGDLTDFEKLSLRAQYLMRSVGLGPKLQMILEDR